MTRNDWRIAPCCFGVLLASCAVELSESPPDEGPEERPVAVVQLALGETCTSGAECDDDRFCNGRELCVLTSVWPPRLTCVAGQPVTCNDGISCTADSCSEAARACNFAAPDRDGDGHGDKACRNASGPLGDDCNDADATTFPGNAESCDAQGHDEDCNPSTYGATDADGDGFVASSCCNGSTCGPDCDDDDSSTHPINVDPCDGVDNDCDGEPDENCLAVCADEVRLYPDADGDGYGNAGASPVMACEGTENLAQLGNDCDDANPAIRPGTTVCSGTRNTRTCGSDGVWLNGTCPGGFLARCVPQPNGTGVCL